MDTTPQAPAAGSVERAKLVARLRSPERDTAFEDSKAAADLIEADGKRLALYETALRHISATGGDVPPGITREIGQSSPPPSEHKEGDAVETAMRLVRETSLEAAAVLSRHIATLTEERDANHNLAVANGLRAKDLDAKCLSAHSALSKAEAERDSLTRQVAKLQAALAGSKKIRETLLSNCATFRADAEQAKAEAEENLRMAVHWQGEAETALAKTTPASDMGRAPATTATPGVDRMDTSNDPRVPTADERADDIRAVERGRANLTLSAAVRPSMPAQENEDSK